jgi:S1-C subfamily serine protease
VEEIQTVTASRFYCRYHNVKYPGNHELPDTAGKGYEGAGAGSHRKCVEEKSKSLDDKINFVDRKNSQPIIATPVRYNGTGFLIDAKGLMITNAHVVKNSRNIFVQNNKGDQFRAFVVRLDVPRDVAIIKIDDDSFKSFASLPYGIRRTVLILQSQFLRLVFPR